MNETELLDLLKHALTGSSPDHKRRRISGLEELNRNIQSDSIQNIDAFTDLLLQMAILHGDTTPLKSLIIKSISMLIEKNDGVFEEVLDRIKGQEDKLFIVFSELTSNLDYKKKKQAIKPLLNFLLSRENENSKGAKEVYFQLVALGNQKLSQEIVKEASLYLDSNEISTVLYVVRLCSEFGDQSILPQMVGVLQKSMDGYFDAHHTEIDRKICNYFERLKDQNSFPQLMNLIKLRYTENPTEKVKALTEILNAHPFLVDDVLDAIYDAKQKRKLVTTLLQSLESLEKPPSAGKIIQKIGIRYWHEHPARFYLKTIFVKGGKASKPVLQELLKDPEKYEYALECWKELGFSSEDLARIFPKSPILQIYDFFYSQKCNKKMPKDLNSLWREKKKLSDNVSGSDKLEHLITHIFSSFNFVTLNLAPLKFESVDIIGFYPETLDLLIIGCTTGVLKDDLAKMDAIINEMEKEMPDIFKKCTVTPIVVCSKDVALSQADAKYSMDQGISILEDFDIDKLLEMLSTQRTVKQVITYIDSCKYKHDGQHVGY